ncbi:DUF3284 domain-containing protein [Alkalicella caledoniensis]|uniref:DUF3284 domain-containing protein n=1 Tax=Alkalicella caledoniensis TaxID=2731377 RepID=A0A7G9W7I0_ALKCA|nr:DUF3284 domain-containing protein [Alkalicella caledoniensis]QNO14642.1 DUF3284 domain-containing protein [Alkalicella caledoniensis]
MSVYKNQKVLDYSAKEIFKVFKDSIKSDFKSFNEKKPVGTSAKKKIASGNGKMVDVKVEITGYKENMMYEIKTFYGKTVYTSKYELIPIEKNKTKLLLTEDQYNPTGFTAINKILANIFYRKKIKARFENLILGLEQQLDSKQ